MYKKLLIIGKLEESNKLAKLFESSFESIDIIEDPRTIDLEQYDFVLSPSNSVYTKQNHAQECLMDIILMM